MPAATATTRPGMPDTRVSSSSSTLPAASTAASSTPSTPRASVVAPESSGAHASSTSSVGSASGARPASSSRDHVLDDPAPAPPSATTAKPSRPRFFSRLSLPLPLRSRNRNVADFYLRADEPHKKYRAGEHVRGVVVLAIVKPVRITHLTVALRGFVRVAREPGAGAKGQASLTLPVQNGSSEAPQYHGNGLASLFQDEQVLSGEGRLEPGKYEFGYDLLFPSKELPSSIDFERGTIAYIVTATLTRPTSIAPTTSCDTRVKLVDRVDIGLLQPPRPKTIFLEPISKRTRRKRSMGMDKSTATTPTAELSDILSEAGSVGPSVVTDDSRDRSTDVRTVDNRTADQSDIRSEISGESGRSVSTGGFSRAELAQFATAKQQVVDDKTITATIELLRGGCLPGDTIPVRVTVQHIKRIRSVSGIIVTLYRQSKIDTAPPSSLFKDMMTREDKRRIEKEEVYPRSKTGLGGLSLSSAGSTSVFRKDLDQVVSPLLVDPETLQTSVTVLLKVPDDAFPTIKGVPGDMVSFKYQAEVIVDLGGRLSSQFQGSQPSRFGQFANSMFEQGGNHFSSTRGHFTDTAPLRREKGVIAVAMETVVGTMDSSRGRQLSHAKSRTVRTTYSDEETNLTDHSLPDESHYGTPYVNGQPSSYFAPQSSGHRFYTPPPAAQPLPPPTGPPQPYSYHENGDTREAAPMYVPPPQLPDPQNMTDKERVRQAEARLLPSQPPAGPSSARDEDDIYDAPSAPPQQPAQAGSGQAQASDNAGEGPSAPTHEDLSGPAGGASDEDKQERERQRLLAEASAPPEVPDDVDRSNDGTSRRDMAPDSELNNGEPSAPMLDDDHDGDYQGYGVGAGSSHGGRQHHSEQLPAYRR